jgi:IclR family transcriptional regulator, acetate operon repressor
MRFYTPETLSAASAKAPARPAYLIESVDNALRLLHLFGGAERIRVSQAAAELDVAPSTAHRLLAMLQYHGFAIQDRRTHEYLPGPNLMRIGMAASKQLGLRTQARPIMERLAAEVDETVGLGILQGSDVLYLDGVDGTQVLRVGARTGALIPAHCISMGKALLAALPADRLDALYPDETLPTMTARSIAGRASLFDQLGAIRRRGFAHSSGESEDGVASIAAPVFDGGGELCAALSIASPATRATPARIGDWLPRLRAAAAELGSRCHGEGGPV